MRHYEVNFIVDPVLSGDEVKATANNIQSELQGYGAHITALDELGLRQLAYAINKRSSGYYYCIEISCEASEWIGKFELNMKRNEKILRFLTVRLDKYGVKYNDDKRNGRIGTKKKVEEVPATEEVTDVVSAPAVVDLDA